ncbi:hypothetical protein [Campylobacter troglodytis]|uniref:hypothetical protein n=1 Tax=Campylobacter troglodytis TaxID=654363 RepID=UPI0011591ABB|nr:hypothetical protein [Campylobacter troglodytis]TQR61412.1 hypothetical protein DMC01_01240 [Campylobacter troglodytis]
MDRIEGVSELSLPDIKERSGFLVYLKIIFLPCLIYILVLLAYFGKIDFKISLLALALMGLILVVALLLARHNAEYASSFLEQQKNDFKQALKSYIMKNFLKIGKETKCNGSFDAFCATYIRTSRNENFANIASSLFSMMGILGTFICIALFVPSFNAKELGALEQEISQFLSGLGAAFYVSIYGVFLSLWWVFFERLGRSKIQKLFDRLKSSTSIFFWTKEELEQRYLTQGLQHFDKVGVIFEQVSNQDFFKELNYSIERKFGLFQEMLNVEEKAIRISAEHIKQTMNELNASHRKQKDLSKVYIDMTEVITSFNHNLKEVNSKLSEQYSRLLELSADRVQHLDKTLSSLDEMIEDFKKSFGHYQELMIQNQEKIFLGFKDSLIQGIREFKEAYEDEKHIDGGIELASKLKAEISELDNEASEVIAKFNKDGEFSSK